MADARLARLRSVPLFAGCTDKELTFIASRVDEVEFPVGKVLTKKGESGGDFFGEIALLDNGPRTATVKAATPMRCLVLGHEQLRDVLHQNAEIAVKVLRAVTQRLRAATPLPTG